MTLKPNLDTEALALLEKASDAELPDRIAIFKAVSTYYINTHKGGKKPAEDEPAEITFDQLVGRLKPTQPGGSA